MSRLVVVSNRVAVPRRRASAPGGLAVGLNSALKATNGLWFGWGGGLTERRPGKPTITRRGGVTYATIDIKKKHFEGFYSGFSNSILWPLFHYQLGYFQYQRDHFEAYNKVNRQFAKRLLPLLKPDDVIWVHDYQLIPLGAALRDLGVDQPLGFFLHIPFPAYDLLRSLPVARVLFENLCQYDLVGFQTASDQAAFLENARFGLHATTDEEGHVTIDSRALSTGVFPIGIDVDDIMQQARMGQGLKTAHRLTTSLQGRLLLMGADRLDYSKGLIERLLAYEALLERYPDVQREVVLLQIAQPSRTGIESYQEISHDLQSILGRINATFAHFDWVPIRYMEKSVSRQTLLGFFRIGQVGVVTPLRDGMNLVAKEYAAAQDPEDPGVLVLSSLAGAARELESALIINPYDSDAGAEALYRAIRMPLAERQDRYQAMMDVLRKNDIHAWRERFLAALAQSRNRTWAASRGATRSR